MRYRLAFFAATLFVCGPANAQNANSSTAPQIVKSVVEDDLRKLVLVEGHSVDAIHPFESPSVRGKTTDGLLFVLVGTACDKQGVAGCQGVMMQIRYDADDSVTDSGIVLANMQQAAVSTWWDKEGKTVGFTRYVVLDDGITMMNLRHNLRVMLSIAPKAAKAVWP